MAGKFITFEGIDGAGKSTHIAWLIERLRHAGHQVVATREPGGTPLGEKLRALLLNEPMHLETETLLMFAARREHLDKLILPALAAGQWVVSDRFTDATYAYQGGGRGLSRAKLLQLEAWVHGGIKPDLTLIFDLDPAIAAQRLGGTGNAPDRFEREPAAFFTSVRNAYLERAAADPARIRLIDASRTPHEVQSQLETIISSLGI